MNKSYYLLLVHEDNSIALVRVGKEFTNEITKFTNVFVKILAGDVYVSDLGGGEKDYYVSSLEDTCITHR